MDEGCTAFWTGWRVLSAVAGLTAVTTCGALGAAVVMAGAPAAVDAVLAAAGGDQAGVVPQDATFC